MSRWPVTGVPAVERGLVQTVGIEVIAMAEVDGVIGAIPVHCRGRRPYAGIAAS